MVSTKDIVNRAREVLERDGWCKHTAHNEQGQHCVVGAVEVAANELLGVPGRVEYGAVCTHVAEYLWVDGVTPRPWHVPTWNDMPERTYEDVILALKRAGHDG